MLGSPPAPHSPSTSEKASSRPCSPPSAAQAQTNTQSQSRRRRPSIDLSAPFPAFDCEDAIIFPFQDETARDDTFQKELNEMLLDAALEAHAWASARPIHETDLAVRKFETQILHVQEQEGEQEKTRQRLNEFVTRMKSALAALLL
ncbi:hypothetical protein C8R43DRAFT_1025769 [Mycena crocata]|nr:hypothetical protein C8R43DRAFT_1025769 [Mycena crocata]